jgi:hypothetical protein
MTDESTLRLLPSFPVGSRADLQLRDQLRTIRDRADGGTRDLIDDILEGRASLRELTETRFFMDRFVPLASDQQGRARLREEVSTVVEEVPDPLAHLREIPDA